MPEHSCSNLPESNIFLSDDEILYLSSIFVSLGVEKIRITGGEPLLRPNLPNLINKLSKIHGLHDLALTTNGSLLEKFAYELKASGLNRLTVSLDSIDNNIYNRMTGNRGNLIKVICGIKKAQEAGFNNIKINSVIIKGVNDSGIIDLVNFARENNLILRFIEYMDAGNSNNWTSKDVLPFENIFQTINKKYPLKILEPNYKSEVASRYGFYDGKGEIGFISSISKPFCHNCSRIRLTSDGKIYNCLFTENNFDLKTALQNNLSREDLAKQIINIWENRRDCYSQIRSEFLSSNKAISKPEMFQIGG